ncbi:peroxisomal (S)-2-hydroxy-acid oxidase [Colletotrichum orchidophilum]|uniref:Peroxisomal (S)-2-hydroxy-acid oxidase n=1 Tax=Colletotrichum orchidophilum TaxID=1209926 RepID=A0A1G4BEU2_9PEZI|nr:peroxisomal (S)-2-hydroxy-acid oxidase [Colletotrichum orchidophilum]OHE99857.1 peroxisomal (S)-2-hydroxy-acid oxidase [Colletotrichum orchidophilum]
MAGEPLINEFNTGFVTYLDSTNYTKGFLTLLETIRVIPNFDWATRYDTINANSDSSGLTWNGITIAEDATLAVEKGAKAIYISDHGGRQLAHTPGPLEIDYQIYRNAAEDFQKVDVLIDNGVRCGKDVLKPLALASALDIIKTEIVRDGSRMSATDVHDYSTNFLVQHVFPFDKQ